MEVLPELLASVDDDSTLSAAVKCLAVAIMSGGPARKAPIADGLEAYGSALRSLTKGLARAEGSFPDDLVASVMCLLLAEASPSSLTPSCPAQHWAHRSDPN